MLNDPVTTCSVAKATNIRSYNVKTLGVCIYIQYFDIELERSMILFRTQKHANTPSPSHAQLHVRGDDIVYLPATNLLQTEMNRLVVPKRP